MKELTIKTAVPSEQYTRLYRMGLVAQTGSPELLGLETLASICSGCLYDDLGADAATNLYREALASLTHTKPQFVYEILTHAYSPLSEPVPKPVELLAKDENCLLYYIFAFLENWRVYLKDDGMLED